MGLFKRKDRVEHITAVLKQDEHLYDEYSARSMKKWARDFNKIFKDMKKNGTPEELKGYLAYRHTLDCWKYDLKDMEETIFNTKEMGMDLPDDRSLPPRIGELTNLESLNVLGRALKIPDEFKNLQNLKTLLLAYEGDFPEIICELQQLEELQMTSSQFKSNPLNIGNLINLKYLQFNNVDFTEFPPSITDLIYLNDLGLDGNDIVEIPPAIEKMKNLQRLSLNRNPLFKVAKEISEIKTLKFLGLKQTPLSEEMKDQLKKWLPKTQIRFEFIYDD
ncbi:leucine-rich repeat domain-containing protein [uncultured Microscilla sp.]|uniref:leucine-rich repeat domain-containing protein n=1 Tax=uncultured Microscilla sp. TaxID=432653 RepID=UPI002620A44A|nr:leucine-rich repeat domain-containing protein [uncultured Microscilla sp.]